jgi:group I intron endonuclease
MKISGIYQIQSKIKPERIYIGSSKDIYRRWNQHLLCLKKGSHRSNKLQHHYNKYGKNDLVFSILIGCSINELIDLEQFFLDSKSPWFNTRKIADSNTGLKRSEEHCKKRSLDSIGEKNGFYGKHHSDESKQLKREWNLLHEIKPPTYHGGRPMGAKNKVKLGLMSQN